jgi:hypothetical protein
MVATNMFTWSGSNWAATLPNSFLAWRASVAMVASGGAATPSVTLVHNFGNHRTPFTTNEIVVEMTPKCKANSHLVRYRVRDANQVVIKNGSAVTQVVRVRVWAIHSAQGTA